MFRDRVEGQQLHVLGAALNRRVRGESRTARHHDDRLRVGLVHTQLELARHGIVHMQELAQVRRRHRLRGTLMARAGARQREGERGRSGGSG